MAETRKEITAYLAQVRAGMGRTRYYIGAGQKLGESAYKSFVQLHFIRDGHEIPENKYEDEDGHQLFFPESAFHPILHLLQTEKPLFYNTKYHQIETWIEEPGERDE